MQQKQAIPNEDDQMKMRMEKNRDSVFNELKISEEEINQFRASMLKANVGNGFVKIIHEIKRHNNALYRKQNHEEMRDEIEQLEQPGNLAKIGSMPMEINGFGLPFGFNRLKQGGQLIKHHIEKESAQPPYFSHTTASL